MVSNDFNIYNVTSAHVDACGIYGSCKYQRITITDESGRITSINVYGGLELIEAPPSPLSPDAMRQQRQDAILAAGKESEND
jgi:hypothetical protein